jgi:hypothetical protein
MELQKTDPQTPPTTTRRSGPEEAGCHASPNNRESTPPEGYDPITEIKRQRRWEQTFDVDGSLWDVREARATKHGFDLLFGLPANSHLSGKVLGGPARLIATPALVAYWEINRFNEGTTYDLPAGRTTMKRLRTRLRFNFVQDRRKFWEKRTGDLQILPTSEFAERYNVNKEVTSHWRLKMVGRTARPLGWWHHPEALAVLCNTSLKFREVASALSISISHAKRLQTLALAFDAKKVEEQPEVVGPIPTLRFPRKPTVPPVPCISPFRDDRKQGRLFSGSAWWRPARKTLAAAEPSEPSTESKTTRIMPSYPFSKRTAMRTRQLLLFSPPRAVDSNPMLFQVPAFDGTFYDVYESRPTKHGFDLLFGYPTKAHRRIYAKYNKTGLIPTAELVAYWEAHRIEDYVNFDLPAGETTLKRLRQRLGFNVKRDQRLAKA